MTKETGGPAFPCNVERATGGDMWSTAYGMTLRDWFAAHASEYDINRHMPTGKIVEKIKQDGGTKHIYQEAEMRTPEQARYHYADEMLEARK